MSWLNRKPKDTPEDRATNDGQVSRRSTAPWTVKYRNDPATSLTGSLDGWKTSAVVARCLDLTVPALAARPLAIVNAAGEPVATEHPLLTVYNKQPGNGLAPVINRRVFWGRLERYGQAHAILDRGPTGTGPVRSWLNVTTGSIAMVLTKPDRVHPYGELVGWWIGDGPARAFYRWEEVLWARYPDPDEYWGAISPLAAALSAIGLHEAARRWQSSEFNGGSARAMVYINNATEEEIDGARDQIDAMLSGSDNAGRVAVAGGQDGALTVTPLGLSAKEMSYIDSLKVANDEVAMAMSIPIDLISGQTTYDNLKAAGTQLWSMNLLNKLAVVGSAVDTLLVPEVALTAGFDTSDVPELQDSEDGRVRRLQQTMYADIRTINEAREEEGLPPLEGGDVTLTGWRALVNGKAAAAAGVDPAARVNPDTHLVVPESVRLSEEAIRAEGVVTPVEKILRARAKHEAIGVRAVNRIADQQEKATLNLLKRALKRSTDGTFDVRKADDPAHLLGQVWNPAAMDEAAANGMAPWLEAAYMASALTAAKGLGVDAGDPVFSGAAPAEVLAAVDARAQETATLINSTTGDALAATLVEGVAAGEGADKLAARVKVVFGAMKTDRAHLIAEDTVLGAMHHATRIMTIAHAGGRDVTREWHATKDSRTRSSHAELDGYRTNDMHDRYPNGALYPGDRAAGPAESVRCRCVELIHVAA